MMKFICSERSFEWWVIAVSALITSAAAIVFFTVYFIVQVNPDSISPKTVSYIGYSTVATMALAGLSWYLTWQRWRQQTGSGATILPFQRRRRS